MSGTVTPIGGAPLVSEIDHVAIAVHDLDAAIEWYQRTFRAGLAHRELVERDGVEEALVKVGDSYVQLVSPTRADSSVAKFLATHGEGLHHVAYRVADCAVAIETVRASGAKVIDDTPRRGSRDTLIAFLHPKGSLGTLIELVEEGDSSLRR